MPTKARKHEKYGKQVMIQHWTRKEQIANARQDGTLDEMEPKL